MGIKKQTLALQTMMKYAIMILAITGLALSKENSCGEDAKKVSKAFSKLQAAYDVNNYWEVLSGLTTIVTLFPNLSSDCYSCIQENSDGIQTEWEALLSEWNKFSYSDPWTTFNAVKDHVKNMGEMFDTAARECVAAGVMLLR